MGDGFYQIRDTAPERAFVAAIARQNQRIEADLAELTELLHTALCQPVGQLIQRRDQPELKTYLGSGKVDELEEELKATEAEVLVIDDELTPSQQRYLENRFKIRVIDRTALILDIFAAHAHSAEGKLQVELAQLEYQLPRMRGMWQHLERLGGGVGTRGPGESQLETDRRLARDRITALRRKLKETGKRRRLQRKQRTEGVVPTVSLAGYTNVGKSSLLNALTGAEVSSRNRLFETLDPTTRRFTHVGREYTITDTVGFIRKLPHGLVEAFASTLEETLSGDLMLHIVDASLTEEERDEQMRAVDDVLSQIGADELPRIVVLNKIDLVSPEDRQRLHNRLPDALQVSSHTREGLDELEIVVAEHFAGRFEPVELLVPHSEGGALSALYALGAPISQREDTAEGVRIRARLPKAERDRYLRFEVTPEPIA
ncbi:MAG: GTPase HflX [Actinobacteria bacterium]|nr:GTPase HflX [Actinomycetota bacterium]